MLQIIRATPFIVFELLRDNQIRDVGVELNTHIHTHKHLYTFAHTHINTEIRVNLCNIHMWCLDTTNLIFSSFEKYIFFYCDTFLKQSFYGHVLHIEKSRFE